MRLSPAPTAAGWATPASRTVTLQYNALGMLLHKSDVGNYSYPAQGVANGGTPRATWQYDENHQRIKEVRVNASGTRTTWYLHPDNAGGLGFEREEPPAGSAQNRHFISAGGMTFAVMVTTGALPKLTARQTAPAFVASITAVKVEYWHKDQLGSLIATTSHAGAVTGRYAYDPFGKRRYTNSTYDAFGNLVIDWTTDTNTGNDRGFTGHEHLDDLGVIHMNGRIYDPTVGRFMQADPFVQDLMNLQNFDRYAYCYNSPLICTDPTGYFSLKKLFRAIAAIVVAFYLGPIIANHFAFAALDAGILVGSEVTFGGIAGSAVAGFASGAIAGGSLKAGLQGAFSGALFFGVGQAVGDAGLSAAGSVKDAGEFASAITLHGVAGCIASVAGGGKCGPGALSAAFSKAALPLTAGGGNGLGRAFAHAIIGGTASVLGGGKFANGAQTGAFGYLFNCLAHGCNMKSEGYEPTKYPNGTVCNATSAACTAGTGTDAEVAQGAMALMTLASAPLALPLEGGAAVMLGLRAYRLESTAAGFGARTFLSDPNWKVGVMDALANSSTQIMVSLDGFAGGNSAGQIMNAISQGAARLATPTNWEIYQLYRSGRLGEAVLVQGGKIVTNPFGK